jgi:hypothetical protein
LNCEKISKIEKKIVKRYGKYGRNVTWYGKYGGQVSWIMIWKIKKKGKLNSEKDMENTEEK